MNNKIPCGGFYLSDTLGVDENGNLGVNGGEPYKSLVTDGNGNVKWEDSLAYEYTDWKDFVLNTEMTIIDGFVMPPIGDTVTVKVNGVESIETVKSGEMEGMSYSYIGSTDMAGLTSGTEGWIVFNIGGMSGLANPETTVSLCTVMLHKIADSYLPNDLLKSPYPIQIINFDEFLRSFGFKVFVGGDDKVGTNNFSLSKEKWDEFLNYLTEFNSNNVLCLSSSFIVYEVKPNAGRPTFYSVGTLFDGTNNVYAKQYKLSVSYNEETETVTAIKSVIQTKIS